MGILSRATPLLITILGFFLVVPSAEAGGPWRAQVVDAETGQPIEGVVILAYWIKYKASPGGWAGAEYYAAEEVVTGRDGRFEIPAKIAFNWLPFLTQIRGPEFKIFKPGHGRWRVRGIETLPEAWRELQEWDLLAKDGIVIELPPLKTREQRLKFYGALGWPGFIPPEKTRRMREAEDAERAYFGFRSR